MIADSVERAVKNLSEFQVSGLITEYWIGDVKTLEAIQVLKKTFPESYVMMITDKEIMEDEYEEIMEAGVDDYFLKPFSIRKILLHLRKGLKHQNLPPEKNHLEDEQAASGSSTAEVGTSKMEIVSV